MGLQYGYYDFRGNRRGDIVKIFCIYIVGNNLYLCYSSVVIMLPVDLKRNANYTIPYSKRAFFVCIFRPGGIPPRFYYSNPRV